MATHSSVLAWRIPGTGAWWAAVYGVAQSRARLQQLSSSSRGLYCSFSLISVFSKGRKRGGGSARAHRNTRFTYYVVGQRLEPLPSKLGHMLRRQGPSGLPHCHPRRGQPLCVLVAQAFFNREAWLSLHMALASRSPQLGTRLLLSACPWPVPTFLGRTGSSGMAENVWQMPRAQSQGTCSA